MLSAQPKDKPKHPVMANTHPVGMLTAEEPRFPSVPGGNKALMAEIQGLGGTAEETEGHYGSPEKSLLVYNLPQHHLTALGKRYGQKAVIHNEGGQRKLIYINGPDEGTYHPGTGQDELFQTPPAEGNYTKLPGHGYVRLGFDFGQKIQMNRISKSTSVPWAGSYEWHDGHTSHHQDPVLKAEGETPFLHPHNSVAPKAVNDQAAGKGVSTYKQYAQHYGHIDDAAAQAGGTNLKHYNFDGLHDPVNAQVAQHGYQVYYAGGKYGKPDLANKNYNTKHLMIYNPEPDSGGDFGDTAYTDSWRKTHELGHALTYPELNEVYGEGRRIGKLGVHRTQHEAERAVHWEWLAAHKQRDLLGQLGHHVPDNVFHKELNTVMHDAVHRAVTGQFTEPSQEGFVPSEQKVPLETSLGLVRHVAQTIGLHDRHALKPKIAPAAPKIVKSESQVGSRIWSDWLKVVEFLTPGKTPSLDSAKAVLAANDNDQAAAACASAEIEPNPENVATAKAIYQLLTGKVLAKSEEHQVDPSFTEKAQIKALNPAATGAANDITDAFYKGHVVTIKLDGKHSGGDLLVSGGKTWLCKKGSGHRSPAAGIHQESASMSARECAFYDMAVAWGVPDFYPESRYISLNGQEYAAMEFLSNNYKDLEIIKEANEKKAEQFLEAKLRENLPHIWAVLDYVLGNVDSHAGNIMVDPENDCKLIDHGSAFAGTDFSPGKDPYTFCPYYLRFTYTGQFNKLKPEEQLEWMVWSPDPDQIKHFIETLDEQALVQTLSQYHIEPQASLQRLRKLQGLCQGLKADLVLNRLWIGLL